MGNSNDTKAEAVKKLKETYFKSINALLKSSYDDNRVNRMNTAACMNKIGFIPDKSCLKVKLTPNKEYVHWKRYLFIYLRKEAARDLQWAMALYNALQDEDFFSELHWQSVFFYKEYLIMTKPQCLESVQTVSFDLSKIESPQFPFIHQYMGSFASSNSQADNQPFTDFNAKHFIKQYIDVFHDHLFNKDHPINIIITLFEKEFSQLLAQTIEKSKQTASESREELMYFVVEQLQRFIVEMQVVVKLFYCKAISYRYFYEEKDEFNNLVTSLLFKTGRIYEVMFALFAVTYEKEMRQFKRKLRQYKDITQEELGIDKQFRLDNSTRTFQVELKATYEEEIRHNRSYEDSSRSEEHSFEENSKEKIDIDKKPKQKRKARNKSRDIKLQFDGNHGDANKDKDKGAYNQDLVVVSESQKLSKFTRSRKSDNTITHYDNAEPFKEAIELLKTFDSLKAPFEKILAIATISAEITASVNNAWYHLSNAIPQSLLKIGADQLMNIYLYIIIKAQMEKLFIHLCFARHFTSDKTKSISSIGYYFNTLEGCISYILEMKDKGLIEEDGKNSIDGSIN